MGENIVINHGIFYDGSTKEEIDYIHSIFPNRNVIIHMIRPNEAHITVTEKIMSHSDHKAT